MDLNRYSDEQIEAIESEGNVCLLAGAGGGKTAVLIARTAYLIKVRKVDPSSIVLLTFSKKASEVMKERLEGLIGKNNVNIGTFHSIFYNVLREEDAFFKTARIMREWDKKKIICDCVVRKLGLERQDNNVNYADILRFIDMQKQFCKHYSDKDFVECGDLIYDDDMMRLIYEDYEDSKRSLGVMDFQDMIFGAYMMFRESNQILKKYQKKFNYFLLDEVQDSPLQQIELIQMLNEGNEQTFVVGDYRQSLYSFIGGSPKYILEFEKLFKNSKVIHLSTNYRSSTNIVEFSNNLLVESEESAHKHYKEAKANKGLDKKPEFSVYQDDQEEAFAVGERIKDLMSKDKSLKWKDFGVIYRVNSQSCAIERAFSEMNIPYMVYSTSKSFFELKEIQDILSFLKLGLNQDNRSFKRIYCVPLRYLGKQFLDEVDKLSDLRKCTLYKAMGMLPQNTSWRYRSGIEDLTKIHDAIARRIGKGNIGDLIRMIRKITGYDNYILKESDSSELTSKCDKIDNLDSLCDQASHYVDVDKFLSDIDKIIMNKEEQVQAQGRDKYVDIDAVGVATSHRFKGSEFKHVFGISINDAMYPHYKATNHGEELRNLYVLVSRAESGLYLSSTLWNKSKASIPSKFLYKVFSKDDIAKQTKICKLNNQNSEKMC